MLGTTPQSNILVEKSGKNFKSQLKIIANISSYNDVTTIKLTFRGRVVVENEE